jgi:hypothetical protein
LEANQNKVWAKCISPMRLPPVATSVYNPPTHCRIVDARLTNFFCLSSAKLLRNLERFFGRIRTSKVVILFALNCETVL